MKGIYFLLLIFFTACNSSRRISNRITAKVLSDSTARVSSVAASGEKELVYYIAPTGKKILLKKYPVPVESTELVRRRVMEDSVVGVSERRRTTSSMAGSVGANDLFKGSIRVVPKTTYASKKNEKFRTIAALYRKLQSNDFMKNLGIGNKEERVEEEDRNIIIAKAFLYTITVEDDNDIHLLIGNTPVYTDGVTRVFNAEISGVPRDGTEAEKEKMKQLRAKAIEAIGDIPLCGRSGYLQTNRRITIRGSLFFDSHHATKPAKCREVEGESAWEIHPVKDISFK